MQTLTHHSTENFAIRGLYVGFDPSAKSLHAGNLLPLMLLIRSGALGIKPCALVHHLVSDQLIGAIDWRGDEKPILPSAAIDCNSTLISSQIQSIYDRGLDLLQRAESLDGMIAEPKGLLVVNNIDWYSKQSILEFLLKVGRHARITQMLSRNCVQSRLASESGLNFCEFTYQLMQGYDFLHLHRAYGTNIQAGGSDQWGNMVTGLDFIEKDGGSPAACITLPLLQTVDGVKMGKSTGNGLWLDSSMTCIFDFYQFFVSLSDADARKILPYFWLGKVSDLDQIFAEHDLDPSKHEMQKRLAHTITSIAHGKELASAAEKISDMLFYSKPLSLSIRDSGSVLGHYRLRKYMPASSQTSILSFLTTVFPEYSKNQLKNYIKSAALRINHIKILDPYQQIDFLATDANILINLGKQSFYIVQLEQRSE